MENIYILKPYKCLTYFLTILVPYLGHLQLPPGPAALDPPILPRLLKKSPHMKYFNFNIFSVWIIL